MRKPQISASVTNELQTAIKEEAKRNSRSFSEMVEILLQQSINERERIRQKNKRRQEAN
jgi:hypothetical protein